MKVSNSKKKTKKQKKKNLRPAVAISEQSIVMVLMVMSFPPASGNTIPLDKHDLQIQSSGISLRTTGMQ